MSVKIAFWGMEESCHITENMIVMSWLLAKIRPAHSIFVHRRMAGSVFFPVEKTEFYLQIVDVAETKTQNSLKMQMLLSQGSIPIRVNGRRSYAILQSDTKGSLSGRRLCIACKPVKDGYDGQVSYCAGTDRLYPAKRGIGVGVSAGKN